MDDDAATTAIVGTAFEYDAVYINMPGTAATVQGLMDVKTIDSDGFTMIMDDADPSQAFVWYLAFGLGGTTFNQSINPSASSSLTLIKAVNKFVAVTNTPSFAKTALINKTLSYTAPDTTTVIKQAGKFVSASSNSDVTMIRALVFVKEVVAGVSNAVSVVRQTGKNIAVSASNTATIIKSAAKTISASTSNVVTFVKNVSKSIAVSIGNAIDIAAQFISGSGTTFNQVINATVSSAVDIRRSVQKNIDILVISVSQVTKHLAQIITLTASNAVTTATQMIVGMLTTFSRNIANIGLSIRKTRTISLQDQSDSIELQNSQDDEIEL
jgi:hypothetical protein